MIISEEYKQIVNFKKVSISFIIITYFKYYNNKIYYLSRRCNLITITDLNYIIVPVSEKVKEENLKRFILSQLMLNKVVCHSGLKYFYTFIDAISSYQISYYVARQKCLPFFFFLKIDKNKDSLVVGKGFFSLFLSGELYYYEKFETVITKDDCLLYIQKKLGLSSKSLNVIESPVLLKKIVKKEERDSLITFINPTISYKELIFYVLFLCFLLGGITVFYFLQKQDNTTFNNTNIQQMQNRYLMIKKEKTKTMDTGFVLVNLLNSLYTKGLQLKEIKYQNSLFDVIIESSNKKSIYALLQEYPNELVVKNILFNTKENSYALEATFRKSK